MEVLAPTGHSWPSMESAAHTKPQRIKSAIVMVSLESVVLLHPSGMGSPCADDE